MDKTQFKSLMNRAESLKTVDIEHRDYYVGYMRGLRRIYYGDSFGTNDDHVLWYNISKDVIDIIRRLRGCGYRDGYDENELRMWINV